MVSIRPDEISNIIRQQIEGYDKENYLFQWILFLLKQA